MVGKCISFTLTQSLCLKPYTCSKMLKAQDEIPQEASSLKNLGLGPNITIVFTSLFYIETWKTIKLMINEPGMEPLHFNLCPQTPNVVVVWKRTLLD